MQADLWLLLGVFVIGCGAVFGIFKTKTQGFGRYTTSALLLTICSTFVAMAFVSGKIDSNSFMNAIFAAMGFAGGLLVNKE